MSKYYYIDSQGWQKGPVDKEELKRLNISPETLVWAENMSGWKRAIDVPEITIMFQQSPQNPAYTTPPPPPVRNIPGRRPLNTPPPYSQNTDTQQRTTSSCEQTPYIGQRPPTYLWLAICSTLLCCLPFGIVSIVYSSKVDSRWYAKDYDEARRCSDLAKNWGLASVFTAIGLWMVYLIAIIAAGN